MAQIRNVDGLVMGQSGANPMIMGTRMVTNAKGTPGYQYRYTIASGNPLIHIYTRFYLTFSQTNAPSEDFWTSEIASMGTYFDTSGNGTQSGAQDWRDSTYVGYGQIMSTRQADTYFYSTSTSAFPGAFSSVAFIWCNRWDYVTVSLL